MFRYNEKYVSEKEGHFYSCKWIESGLVFFQYKLTMCCYCGHTGGGHVMLRNNYNGHNINWDRVFWLKKKFKEFHRKAKIHESCVDCPFLEEGTWDNDENYIDNIYISHWTHCNSKCVYCYSTQHPENFQYHKPYSVLPQIKELIDKKILRPGGSIHFGGGEPTLLDEFEDVIKLLLDNGFYGMRIHTSGIKYSPIIEKGISEGKLYVVVSTDAGCAETYEKIKQVPCYDKVRENISRYGHAQVNIDHLIAPNLWRHGTHVVSSKFIIMPGVNDNIKEIESWIKANQEAGLETTVIDIEENWYKEHKDNIPDHIIRLIRYVRKRSEELNTNFEMYERIENIVSETKIDKLIRKVKDLIIYLKSKNPKKEYYKL